jgi:UDP-4-amino-4,6-dideoxy-N-acetyl-beta-L-altrosamine transaminase
MFPAIKGKDFLPYGRQSVDEADIAAVVEVLRSDYLTTGPAVAEFEAAVSAATGAPFVVACANGTAALHLAALALEIGPGDCAIVPAITFVATANAVRNVGAQVVFADVDSESGLMEAEHVEAASARAPGPIKAIFPVHLNGQCADLSAIRATADRLGAAVVEDACHALGGKYRGNPVGSGAYGDVATFSFHPVKTVTCGEGGAVAMRDSGLHRIVTRLRNHGIERDAAGFADKTLGLDAEGVANPWYYEVAMPGLNYRLSDIQAALGARQLTKLGQFVATRRRLVAAYRERLRHLAPLIRPIALAPDNDAAWHLMVVLIDFDRAEIDRAQLMRRLHISGIGSQVHYIPLPWQPYYRALDQHESYPGAEEYYERCLSVPLFPDMEIADVERVVEALAEALHR